jgi:hypothetical protein
VIMNGLMYVAETVTQVLSHHIPGGVSGNRIEGFPVYF